MLYIVLIIIKDIINVINPRIFEGIQAIKHEYCELTRNMYGTKKFENT